MTDEIERLLDEQEDRAGEETELPLPDVPGAPGRKPRSRTAPWGDGPEDSAEHGQKEALGRTAPWNGTGGTADEARHIREGRRPAGRADSSTQGPPDWTPEWEDAEQEPHTAGTGENGPDGESPGSAVTGARPRPRPGADRWEEGPPRPAAGTLMDLPQRRTAVREGETRGSEARYGPLFPPGRSGLYGGEGAAALYARLRRAGEAEQYRGRAGAAAETAPAEAGAAWPSVSELDRAFQRDARRYDSGFELF